MLCDIILQFGMWMHVADPRLSLASKRHAPAGAPLKFLRQSLESLVGALVEGSCWDDYNIANSVCPSLDLLIIECDLPPTVGKSRRLSGNKFFEGICGWRKPSQVVERALLALNRITQEDHEERTI